MNSCRGVQDVCDCTTRFGFAVPRRADMGTRAKLPSCIRVTAGKSLLDQKQSPATSVLLRSANPDERCNVVMSHVCSSTLGQAQIHPRRHPHAALPHPPMPCKLQIFVLLSPPLGRLARKHLEPDPRYPMPAIAQFHHTNPPALAFSLYSSNVLAAPPTELFSALLSKSLPPSSSSARLILSSQASSSLPHTSANLAASPR